MYRMQLNEVEVEVEAFHRVTLLMFSGGRLVFVKNMQQKNSCLALLPISCFCYSPILLFIW